MSRNRPGIGGAMYGAILGDIIGSPFEFDRGTKTKDFELFTKGCQFTDDSVMTAAVAEALMAVGPDATKEEIEEAVTANMQDWGKRYPHAGYGGRFRYWLEAPSPKPYNSYGNGSAMRVSAVGWLYPTLERTREVAAYTAKVTHNHPEGIKGAEATASCIFLQEMVQIKRRSKHMSRRNLVMTWTGHWMRSDRLIIMWKVASKRFRKQSLRFWSLKILRMQ